jgi:hypothetical protein
MAPCVLGKDCESPLVECNDKFDKCNECQKELHKVCGQPVRNIHGRVYAYRCLFPKEGAVCVVANKEADAKKKAKAKQPKRKQKSKGKKAKKKSEQEKRDAVNESVLSIESTELHEMAEDKSDHSSEEDFNAELEQYDDKSPPSFDEEDKEAFLEAALAALCLNDEEDGSLIDDDENEIFCLEDGEVVDLATLEEGTATSWGNEDDLPSFDRRIIFDEESDTFRIPLPYAEPGQYWKFEAVSKTVSLNRDDSSAARNGVMSAFPDHLVHDAICAFHAQPYYWGRRKAAFFTATTREAMNAKKKLLNNDFMQHKNVPFLHLV